jgi:hypothetical protein
MKNRDVDFIHLHNSITPPDNKKTLNLIKSRTGNLSYRQLQDLIRHCKHKIHLIEMEKWYFKKWEQGKVTPANNKILKEWEHKIELRRLKRERNRKLSNMCFEKWCDGKATPLDAKIKGKFESRQFKQIALKYYGIDCNNYEFSIHHLIPKKIFPSLKFDINNTIPLPLPIHKPIHTKYSHLELAIDPLFPVIESLETAFMESK